MHRILNPEEGEEKGMQNLKPLLSTTKSMLWGSSHSPEIQPVRLCLLTCLCLPLMFYHQRRAGINHMLPFVSVSGANT